MEARRNDLRGYAPRSLDLLAEKMVSRTSHQMTMTRSMRLQLQQHLKQQFPDAQDLLTEKFKGRSHELYDRILMGKRGEAQPGAIPQAATCESHRKELIASKHHISTLDLVLEKFRGREHEIRAALRNTQIVPQPISQRVRKVPQTRLRGLLSFLRCVLLVAPASLGRVQMCLPTVYSTGKSQSLFSSLQHDTRDTGAKNQVQNDTAVTPALKNSHTLDFTGKRELIDESRAAELFEGLGPGHLGQITNMVLGTKSFDVPLPKWQEPPETNVSLACEFE